MHPAQDQDGGGGDTSQLFRVVYDPHCDRFFLQDELTSKPTPAQRGSPRRQAASAKKTEVPWSEWVLPPKSASKKQQQRVHAQLREGEMKNSSARTQADGIAGAMATLSIQPVEAPNATVGAASQATNGEAGAAADPPTAEHESKHLPQLDLSSITAAPPFVNASNPQDTASSTVMTAAKTAVAATPSVKKARIRSYIAHFKHANTALPAFPHELVAISSNEEGVHSGDEAREIRWEGEPIRVRVACENSRVDDDDSTSSRPLHSTNKQAQRDGDDGVAVQHVFELQQLQRIRPRADGFRDNNVNADCTFTPLTSPSSASSSSSPSASPSSSSSFSDDGDALPVFHKGDRVLFRAKHRRRLRGRIARRIRTSSFYDVRAANGTLFLAVSALRIRLLPSELDAPPPLAHNFQRGDRVLWLPAEHQRSHDADSALTYKARVLRLRSLHRFDIQLRTGRVLQKIPYEELRPHSHDT